MDLARGDAFQLVEPPGGAFDEPALGGLELLGPSVLTEPGEELLSRGVMDIRMPNVDGLEATRRLVHAGSATRILILTTFDLDEYVYAGLRAGASGFLLKDASPEQLIAAIHVISQGDAVLSPSVTRRVVEAFHRLPARQDHLSTALESLTAREREVLGLLARGLSNTEIARDLVVARPPPRRTSATCWPSLACATACTPSSSPTSPGSCRRAPRDAPLHRGAYMITATPASASAAPVRSKRSGRNPSQAMPQHREPTMNTPP